MNLNCIVIDDEPLGRKILEDHIAEISELNLLGSFKSAMDAQVFLDQAAVQLIFLDVNMPKITGIDWMRSLQSDALVILTTAYSEYAVEAFEVEAFDFLVKPISLQRFLTSVNRAKKFLKSDKGGTDEASYLPIKEGKRLYKIKVEDVFYLQAYGDYVRIFTQDKTYITKDRMHAFQEQLPDFFLQAHRSYIVNMKHVQYLEGNQLKLLDALIPISAKFRKDVLDRL